MAVILMALSKKTGKVLKGVATVGGVAATFTPIGGIVGLSGAAAVAADLAGGAVIGKVADKGVKKFSNSVDERTKGHKKDAAQAKDQSKDKQVDKGSNKDGKNKAKSELGKTALGLGATGLGTSALGKTAHMNSRGRNLTPTLGKFSKDYGKGQAQSQKQFQNDLDKAGIVANGAVKQTSSGLSR